MNRTDLWDDGWSFRKTALGVTYEEALAGEFTAVDIPHDWLIYDTHNLYESSTGWYRKSFTLTKEQLGKKLIVRFGAVYMDSTVFVNGSKVCEWKYGYSTFDAVPEKTKTAGMIMAPAKRATPVSKISI